MKQKRLHTVYEHGKQQGISERKGVQFIIVRAGFHRLKIKIMLRKTKINAYYLLIPCNGLTKFDWDSGSDFIEGLFLF